MKHQYHRALTTIVLVTLFGLEHQSAEAQPNVVQSPPPVGGSKAAPKGPRTLEMTVYPAAEAKPALRYPLLPSSSDRHPGNAAVRLNKIAMSIGHESREPLPDKISEWSSTERTPMSQLPLAEAKKELAKYQRILKDLDVAVRFEDCDWYLLVKEQDLFSLRLPEVHSARESARLNGLQTRIQIQEGRYHQAVRSLQTSYALGQHLAEGPTLVNALVAVAISGIASSHVAEFIQQPDAPNLYWGLTHLPRPLIDLHPAAQGEMDSLFLSVLVLSEIDETNDDPEYWRRVLDQTWGLLLRVGGEDKTPLWQVRLMTTGLALRGYPMARRGLIADGRSMEEVDAMSVPQIVALYTIYTHNELRDNTFKWFHMPYHEASAGFERAEYGVRAAKDREVIPVASMLLPAVSAAAIAQARMDREIAMLRVVEAIRMYAASHDGRLPEKLDDITQVPIPINPFTGEAFGYKVEGNTATLEGHPAEGQPPYPHGRRYVITMGKP